MRIVRACISGAATLVLLALLSALYLSRTFGEGDPGMQVLALAKDAPAVRFLVILFSLHLLGRGVDAVLRRGMRGVPSALVSCSLALLIAAFLLSILRGERVQVRIGPAEAAAEGVVLEQIALGLPDSVLLVGEQQDFQISAVTAVIDDQGVKKVLRSWPFTNTSAGYAYVNDAGISPVIEVLAGGKRMRAGLLDVLPPGGTASLQFDQDHGLELSLLHSREFTKGRLTAREYDLRSPRYRVVIKKQGKVVLDGIARDGVRRTGGSLELTMGPTKQWVEIVLVRDRAVPLLYGGLGGLLLGLLLFAGAMLVPQRTEDDPPGAVLPQA